MIRRLWLPLLLLPLPLPAAATSEEMLDPRDMPVPGLLLRTAPPPRRPSDPPRAPECPPCFNCLLPAFSCGNSGECNPYDGQCRCPPGFGGQDCLTPRMSPPRVFPVRWLNQSISLRRALGRRRALPSAQRRTMRVQRRMGRNQLQP